MVHSSNATVSQYIIRRLQQIGVNHIFSVPGDYVLDFMDRIVDSPIELIGNCNELNAGYATDAYARLNGIGAAVVTYGVGGFSILNAVAGSYAERVPVIMISGAPNSARRESHALVHHLIGEYTLQYEVFRKITADAVLLTNPKTAPEEIDRVILNCLTQKRPGYIEIPVDMVDRPCAEPGDTRFEVHRSSDPDSLAESVEEAAGLMNAAEKPVILAGIEIERFGLGREMLDLVERIEIPYATTINGKSVIPELHPQFMGVYQGGLSRDVVRKQVEASDCVLALGVWMTDMTTGGFTSALKSDRLVSAHYDRIQIRHHYYDSVWMGDFIAALSKALNPRLYRSSHPTNPHQPLGTFAPQPNTAITIKRFYDRLNRFLDDDMILIAETGDAICAAPELYIEETENFLAQAYYLSIGYGVPAALGVSLARPNKRVVLLEGDGAFQMTAQETSTLIRYECNPIIFLLNNDGLVIERMIHDGPYNDIQQWKYHRLANVFGEGVLCLEVKTEEDMEKALQTAQDHPHQMVFVEVHFSRTDCSEALKRLGSELRKLAEK